MHRSIPRLVCATILLGGLALVADLNRAAAQSAAPSAESRFASGVVPTIEPDIDLDNDGVNESASIGLKVTAIPANLVSQ